jgi:DNA-binding beta-propeller fold protein YncE
MSRSSWLHALRLSVVAPLLAAAGPVFAAALDLEADAVLGKADLTTGFVGGASATNVLSPVSLAEDPVSGELWVADAAANRVLRFASSAANRGGSTGAGTLYNPQGIAVDQAGRVYVADHANNRVLVYRPPFTNGMDASEVVGQPDFTSGAVNRGGSVAANTLHGPLGLALDASGNLWVADRFNNRVMRYPAPVVTGVTPNRLFGQVGYTANAPATSAAGMWHPMGVAIDSSDNLWVAELLNSRVLRFDLGAAGGDIVADLVLCQVDFATAAFGTTASLCTLATGIAVDPGGGAVYVTDSSNHRILRFTSFSNGAAATAVIGQSNFTASQCNRGGAASASTLCQPSMLALGRNGDVLVADYDNGRVLRYDLPRARPAPLIASLSPEVVPQGGGAFTLTVNGSRFHGNSVVNWNGAPLATQFLSDRRLVAQVPAANIASAGPFAVTVTTPAPGGGTSSLLNLFTYARAALDGNADRVLGQPGFAAGAGWNPQVGEERLGARNASSLAQLSAKHVAVDPVSGRLFASDASNNRVLSWASAMAFQNAQPADVVLGQPDEYAGECAAPPTAASLCAPHGIGVDAAGALYVSDGNNHRVLRYLPPFSTGMAASRVFGQGGAFTTAVANSGGVSANGLKAPRGLAVGGGKLAVLDTGNYRLLVYDNPDADFTADVVIGQPDMATAAPAAASASSVGAGEGGIAVDGEGRIYVADAARNRVVRFTPPFTNGMAADLVLGQPDFVTGTTPPASATRLSYPAGLAFDPAGNLVVSDYGNNRVVRFPAPVTSGMAAVDVVGQADFVTSASGTTASRFDRPFGAAMDGVGNVYVTDSGNARILAFDRPFAFALDPATDLDRDGIPNGVEVTESRDPYAKDNDVFGNARLFAMQQYRDFLSREGDPAGIQGWTDLVTAGTYSRPQVIDAFLLSDEFAGAIAPVVRLYFATFLRVPDYAGLTFNAGLVRSGAVTVTQLADFFTASPEFQATYGALTNTQFVTLLYANVLQRAPDQAGLDGWVALLDGGMSRGQVLLGFSDSAEYQAAMASEVLVTMMYAAMLRRSPEPAGFNGWVGFLDAATYTREQAINGFFLSTEYRSRFLP